MKFDATQAQEATKLQLSKLPPGVAENPASELLRIVTSFSTEFGQLCSGVSDYAQLIQQCKPAYDDFKTAIRRTAPDFRPYTEKEKKKYGYSAINLDDPEEDSLSDGSEDGSLERSEGRDEQDGEIVLHSDTPKILYVDEVKQYILGSLTRELPFNVPFSAKEGLIRLSMQTWEVREITGYLLLLIFVLHCALLEPRAGMLQKSQESCS